MYIQHSSVLWESGSSDGHYQRRVLRSRMWPESNGNREVELLEDNTRVKPSGNQTNIDNNCFLEEEECTYNSDPYIW